MLVTTVSPAKTDKPIEITFGKQSRVGPRNRRNVGLDLPTLSDTSGMDVFEDSIFKAKARDFCPRGPGEHAHDTTWTTDTSSLHARRT